MQSRFLEIHQQAAKGKLIQWQKQALSYLALVIILDRFPRNIFCDFPKAFVTDTQTLNLSKQAVSQGFDRQLLPVQRWFIYLPF